MGLDSYCRNSVPITVEDDPRLANLKLCGGMMSGSGSDGSFRGKVYADMVKEITGVSLYQTTIPTEEVKDMADAMATWLADNPGDHTTKTSELTGDPIVTARQEIIDLQILFEVTAAADGFVTGWW